MKRNGNAGFTLVELLVVVLILGILASIAVPQYFKVVEKSRVGEAMSLISTLKSAEERYMASSGSYSSNFTSLDISYPNLTSAAINLKYFGAAIAASAGSGGTAPTFALTLTRDTSSTNVAGRYGVYSIYVNMPGTPVPVISACPGGSGNCDELLK